MESYTPPEEKDKDKAEDPAATPQPGKLSTNVEGSRERSLHAFPPRPDLCLCASFAEPKWSDWTVSMDEKLKKLLESLEAGRLAEHQVALQEQRDAEEKVRAEKWDPGDHGVPWPGTSRGACLGNTD